MTVKEIINSKQELWLNSPPNYPFSERIEKSNIGGLKSFLISTTPDEDLQENIRQMTHEELIYAFLHNGFQFLTTWQPSEVIDLDTAIAERSKKRIDVGSINLETMNGQN